MIDKNYFFLKKWWNLIDKKNLIILTFMLLFSNIFIAISSPIIAERIGIRTNIFIIKNLIFSIFGICIIFIFSFFNEDKILLTSFIGFLVSLILMVVVLFSSSLNKGARRWVYIFGFSLQPSEIIKPFFIVITTYIFTRLKHNKYYLFYAFGIYILYVFLLFLQPDIGMFILISLIFFLELFLVNVEMKIFYILFSVFFLLIIIAYILFPHIKIRIDNFSNSIFQKKENYQIQKSLNAFRNGGFLGKGPLEGSIKNYIPDAHTDFIFSVIGEEFGSLFCMLIIFIYFYITIRFILKGMSYENNFKYLSIILLSSQILFQAVINISVTLNLIPTKGITLPLISYGGSSMISVCITYGFLLALTKKDFNDYNLNENLFV